MGPKTRPVPPPAAPPADARAGETASQDVAPTDEDLRLEALQSRHAPDPPDVRQIRDASRRMQPGLDVEAENEQEPGDRQSDDAVDRDDA